VLAVEPGGLHGTDEELGAVGVGPGVGHGEHAGSRVAQLEVLVGELGAVDGLPSGAVAAGEVAALAHEAGDDAVEGGALVVQRLPRDAQALLARAQAAEVLGRPGDLVGEELHDDAAGLGLADEDVEENLGVLGHGGCLQAFTQSRRRGVSSSELRGRLNKTFRKIKNSQDTAVAVQGNLSMRRHPCHPPRMVAGLCILL
jgi:hypothetical protein